MLKSWEMFESSLPVVPHALVLGGHHRERHVTLDRDRSTDCEHDQDRVHERTTHYEEPYDRVDEFHDRILLKLFVIRAARSL
jgi:hypothetical protein